MSSARCSHEHIEDYQRRYSHLFRLFFLFRESMRFVRIERLLAHSGICIYAAFDYFRYATTHRIHFFAFSLSHQMLLVLPFTIIISFGDVYIFFFLRTLDSSARTRQPWRKMSDARHISHFFSFCFGDISHTLPPPALSITLLITL